MIFGEASTRAGEARAQAVGRIAALFARHGNSVYEDARQEPVTAQAHALQCAQLAAWARAPDSTIAAALLHDIGHLLMADGAASSERIDDRHETVAVPFLAASFGPAVVEPVRLHVQAKRYLVAVDARYADGLSAASVHSLGLQGGPMSRADIAQFESLPFSEEAVRLRRWDDLAKEAGRATPPLSEFLAMLRLGSVRG